MAFTHEEETPLMTLKCYLITKNGCMKRPVVRKVLSEKDSNISLSTINML